MPQKRLLPNKRKIIVPGVHPIQTTSNLPIHTYNTS